MSDEKINETNESIKAKKMDVPSNFMGCLTGLVILGTIFYMGSCYKEDSIKTQEENAAKDAAFYVQTSFAIQKNATLLTPEKTPLSNNDAFVAGTYIRNQLKIFTQATEKAAYRDPGAIISADTVNAFKTIDVANAKHFFYANPDLLMNDNKVRYTDEAHENGKAYAEEFLKDFSKFIEGKNNREAGNILRATLNEIKWSSPNPHKLFKFESPNKSNEHEHRPVPGPAALLNKLHGRHHVKHHRKTQHRHYAHHTQRARG